MSKGERYFTLHLDSEVLAKFHEALRRYQEQYRQPPTRLLLNPEARGEPISVLIEAAKAAGITVEREKFVLVWEAWVGG